MMKEKLRYILLSTFFLAAACSPAKYCAEPDLSLPDSFGIGSTDSTTVADVQWWTVYSDTLLQSLIRQTLEYNKDMMIASERIEEMRHRYRIEKSGLWPSLSARAGGDHEWTDHGGEGMVSDPELNLKFDLSWEIDLWGNLRWASRKGAAEYLSSVEAKRAMQMTLIAEVATAYFELIALDNELRIVNQTLVTRQEGVHQAKLRLDGGLTSEVPYQQAQVELASTASEIPDLKRKIAMKESQICVLAGRYPTKVERSNAVNLSAFDADIPVGIPSDLVRRRPDVRKAEQELMAAKAAVGIAQAERFPRFTINLTAGLENGEFADFFRSPWFYAAGNLVAPLFSFGKRKAKFQAAVASYNQSRLSYEQSVLKAFKEVHDAVITYQTARENTVLKRALRDAAQKNEYLSRHQYIQGAIDYLNFLDAQRKYFDSQVGLNEAVCSEYLALVYLYKSLGGGW